MRNYIPIFIYTLCIICKSVKFFDKTMKTHIGYPDKSDTKNIVRPATDFKEGRAAFLFTPTGKPNKFFIKYADSPKDGLASLETTDADMKNPRIRMHKMPHDPLAHNQMFDIEKMGEFYRIKNNGNCAWFNYDKLEINFDNCSNDEKELFRMVVNDNSSCIDLITCNI
ncbi:hypothetical protein EDEG_00849 [Edhazardia aedis USNM 41457]|uniref:Uncharacterized protein n=1 Tax=Edhazardia aedis (strain USNM 41457) TaxID=1003232 RepID=J8ZZL7_EDHAE|nr:hypothetical protein EDEG_00849 [Edhazardia aedis USNM 41457]|eukprot:EJW05068.1 hypothetical protein EDEG_00849 [Edhazardia aedis USNM 41457]